MKTLFVFILLLISFSGIGQNKVNPFEIHTQHFWDSISRCIDIQLSKSWDTTTYFIDAQTALWISKPYYSGSNIYTKADTTWIPCFGNSSNFTDLFKKADSAFNLLSPQQKYNYIAEKVLVKDGREITFTVQEIQLMYFSGYVDGLIDFDPRTPITLSKLNERLTEQKAIIEHQVRIKKYLNQTK